MIYLENLTFKKVVYENMSPIPRYSQMFLHRNRLWYHNPFYYEKFSQALFHTCCNEMTRTQSLSLNYKCLN